MQLVFGRLLRGERTRANGQDFVTWIRLLSPDQLTRLGRWVKSVLKLAESLGLGICLPGYRYAHHLGVSAQSSCASFLSSLCCLFFSGLETGEVIYTWHVAGGEQVV